MGVRIQYEVNSEPVTPKIEDLDIETVNIAELISTEPLIPFTNNYDAPSTAAQPSDTDQENSGYKWVAWSINLSVGDLVGVSDKSKDFFETLDKIQKVTASILKIVRLFSSDFKSAVRVLKSLLKIILKKIAEIIEGFSSTGIYMSLIFPPFDKRDSKFAFPINGGYKEFSAAVNARCLNSSDIDAPRFASGDVVGGLVLAMIGGTNDPLFLEDMANNFKVLSKFFRFENPMPSPAKNLKAVAGFYRDPDNRREKKLGVKITWQNPESPLTGFQLYRSTSPKGFKEEVEDGNTKESIRVFRDDNFNGGEPVEFNSLPIPNYEYIDFEIEPDTTYYYKVYSVVGADFIKKFKFLEKLTSPVATKIVAATPRECIPVSELKSYTLLDERGNPVDLFDFEGDWWSVSLRDLTGPSFDKILNLFDNLSDKLDGLVDTASDKIQEYIDFYSKKINKYVDIINKVTALLDRLLELRFRGTFLLLNLAPEEGGMQHFVDRFNEASTSGDINTLQGRTSEQDVTNISGDQQNVTDRTFRFENESGGFSQFTEEGIMFGIIIVYGFPLFDGDYFKELWTESESDAVSKSFDRTQKAIESFLGLLNLGE